MGRKTQTTEAMILNNRTYLDYFYRLKELAVNRYEWVGLPSEIDERFLEMALCEAGMAVFFFDEIAEQFAALTCMIGGPLNIYNVPTEITAYAANGYQRHLNPENSVLIFNNYLRQPCFPTLELFARRLYEIERTIDVNIKGQKTPKIMRMDETQRLTMLNLLMKWDGNEPFILADKKLDLDDIKVVDTSAPYVADKLEILKGQIWNEALTYLGIDNTNTDKRERLISDEVTRNMGDIYLQRSIGLNSRNQAARWINEMFGTEISVRWRDSSLAIEVPCETLKEMDNSERIHNPNSMVS